MTAKLLDGKLVSTQLRQGLKETIARQKGQKKRPPGLAVILIGQDPASEVYVKNKRTACLEVGIHSLAYDLPEHTSQKELINLIDELNKTPSIDGILVQLPLPSHIDSRMVIERIHPQKDVDGFHPYNLGRLAQGNPLLRPCTPYGIIQLLNYYNIELTGLNAVIVGVSNIVGRPMGLELLMAKSTVTLCHRKTHDLKRHIRDATLLISATGSPHVISSEWLTPQHIVIDVGIHRQANGHLRGDIAFQEAQEIVQWITPVPGGIGPMTIATLLTNTLQAYQLNSDQ